MTFRMRFLILAVAVCAAVPAFAKTSLDKYKEATFPVLTNYIVGSGVLPVTDPRALMDYLAISECDVYKLIKDNAFKQQEVKQALQKQIETRASKDLDSLYLKIPSSIYVSGYNFDTQSLTILPQSQMKKVNALQIVAAPDYICGDLLSSYLEVLPMSYSAKLNFPVSMLRIPMKKSIAESILPRLDKMSDKQNLSVIYTLVYIQIEPVKPEVTEYGVSRDGLLHGQVDFIDLYADRDRKILLKRLNYGDNY